MGATEFMKATIEPVNKLIDAVSKAIGKIYEPKHTRKMADARAYEIETIANTARNNCDMPIIYNNLNGHLEINLSNFNDLRERAGSRLAFQEITKQMNIDSVVSKTYDLLKDEKDVSEEPVNNDWMIRFINSVEDISDKEMQALWSKILAGEVKQPNSCSLRTLDVLRNLSKQEAELFERISNYITDNSLYADLYFLKNYNINYDNILTLDDCGLINSDGLLLTRRNISKNEIIAQNNEYIITACKLSASANEINVNNFILTEAGKKMYSIIGNSCDNKYFFNYAKQLKSTNDKFQIQLHKIISGNDDSEVNACSKDLLTETELI